MIRGTYYYRQVDGTVTLAQRYKLLSWIAIPCLTQRARFTHQPGAAPLSNDNIRLLTIIGLTWIPDALYSLGHHEQINYPIHFSGGIF
jgi:hypothetical protein